MKSPDTEGTQCLKVMVVVRPDIELRDALAVLLEPAEAAQMEWPALSRHGWLEPPAYCITRVFDEGIVFDNPQPRHRVISLRAVAKSAAKGSTCLDL